MCTSVYRADRKRYTVSSQSKDETEQLFELAHWFRLEQINYKYVKIKQWVSFSLFMYIIVRVFCIYLLYCCLLAFITSVSVLLHWVAEPKWLPLCLNSLLRDLSNGCEIAGCVLQREMMKYVGNITFVLMAVAVFRKTSRCVLTTV